MELVRVLALLFIGGLFLGHGYIMFDEGGRTIAQITNDIYLTIAIFCFYVILSQKP